MRCSQNLPADVKGASYLSLLAEETVDGEKLLED